MESSCDFVLAGFNELLELPLEKLGDVGTEIAIPQFHPNTIVSLCNDAIEQLKKQPSLLRLNGEFHIVGDIHGSLHDLLRLFKVFGLKDKFLFLGDYVDRGSFSSETILLLTAMFVKYPDNIYIIRGNHECTEISSTYGFYAELRLLYNDLVFIKFNEMFSYIPFAAVVNDKYFCVHGGLARSLRKLEQIANVERPLADFSSNPMIHEMVWSDPTTAFHGFVESERGAGVQFGQRVVDEFLDDNKLKAIIRGHQYVESGVVSSLNHKVFTVFTASSYKTQLGNRVGIITISDRHVPEALVWPPMKKIPRDCAIFYTYHEQKESGRLVPLCMLNSLGSNTSIPSAFSDKRLAKSKISLVKKAIPKYKSIKGNIKINNNMIPKIVLPEINVTV